METPLLSRSAVNQAASCDFKALNSDETEQFEYLDTDMNDYRYLLAF